MFSTGASSVRMRCNSTLRCATQQQLYICIYIYIYINIYNMTPAFVSTCCRLVDKGRLERKPWASQGVYFLSSDDKGKNAKKKEEDLPPSNTIEDDDQGTEEVSAGNGPPLPL
jgi:hypothetical protein